MLQKIVIIVKLFKNALWRSLPPKSVLNECFCLFFSKKPNNRPSKTAADEQDNFVLI